MLGFSGARTTFSKRACKTALSCRMSRGSMLVSFCTLPYQHGSVIQVALGPTFSRLPKALISRVK